MTDIPDEFPKSNALTKLFEASTEIVGAGSGAAVGFAVGDLSGAVLGSALGPALFHSVLATAEEIKSRVLGKREETRIGAALFFALEKVRENKHHGKMLRDEGFFEDHPGDRSADKELVEGVLLAAQREYQERKLRFYGALLGNIPFDPQIDRGQANLLIRLGEQLSYRQFCLLGLFAHPEDLGLRTRAYGADQIERLSPALIALLQESFDLYLRGMLVVPTRLLAMDQLIPSEVRLRGMGRTLYEVMELQKIDPQDLEPVLHLLST